MTTLRAARVTDLPLLFRLERAYMAEVEPGSLTGWTAAIDRNLELWTANLERAVVVEIDAEIEAETAGIALWTVSAEGAAVLVTIHVHPAFRRRGLARLLLDRVVADAIAAGCPAVELGVHVDNPARGLYEAAGFTHTGTDGDYELFALRLSAASVSDASEILHG